MITEKNGSVTIEPDTAIQVAQKRVANAALKQPMDPSGAGISAYINGILQSARIDALQELWLNPPNDTWTKQEALDAAVARHLNLKADVLEAQVQAIQLANKPKIHLVS